MKVYSISLLLSFIAVQSPGQHLPTELQTPEIVSVNRMPMRATAFGFESFTFAETRRKERSDYFLSLNGSWKFNWVKNPNDRPEHFYEPEFDDSKWDDFAVPANWELNGYGLPIYLNQPYEFVGKTRTGAALNPPFDIPENHNPVGSYRKKFTLPSSWQGRQVFIHLGAVKSAFFIWVNGKKIGYSEDSKLAAEFDITRYVKPGENLIALQVYRWSDASYLECQDMWRISGIERDVYLYSTPRLDIRDFKVTADLTDEYRNGLLTVHAEINNYKIDSNTLHSKPDTFFVKYELRDAANKVLLNKQIPGIHSVLGNYKTQLSFEEKIEGVSSWSAEIPYLYTLYLSLHDAGNNLLQVVPVRIGFRNVEIINNNFLVNGQRVMIKGVNRHEHNARTGHVLTREDMMKDIMMMKRLNVNAVRNAHYPPDPYWLELCDEYGLYVIDEANIESHGRYYDLAYTLGNDERWLKPHMERVTRMYERDKNHTSVVTWSLGNEAGNGISFYTAYDWLKEQDHRPVQYERAEWDYNTDMIVPQYPDPDWLIRFSRSNQSRPLIMSEYAHIMGNSLGNFQDYWDIIETHPNLQGGFIWEWIDQTFDTVKNGKRIMAYGGDFPLEGPVPVNFSDNNFCVKGVVTAYREMTPMAVEVRKVYQNIGTRWDGQTLRIKNKFFFRDLKNVSLAWEVLENGKLIKAGRISQLNAGPGQEISLPLSRSWNEQPTKEYLLNVRYLLEAPEPFFDRGHQIAYEQFALNAPHIPKHSPAAAPSLLLKRTQNGYTVTGKGFEIAFDSTSGRMLQYRVDGSTLISSGPQPGFWRAPTDNDIGAGFNKSLRMWRTAYSEGKITDASASLQRDGSALVTFTKTIVSGDANTRQSFQIFPDGSVKVSSAVEAAVGKSPLLMRFGNDLEVVTGLNQVKWYGRGPGESYWDRKSGSLIGEYAQQLGDQYFPYVRPQESGNRSDVRWFSLTNTKGKGLRFVFEDSLLNCAALPYSIDDLDPAPEKHQFHSGELEKRDRIYVRVDWQQTGVQGIDSWGSWPLKKYRIPYSDHQYSYWIVPLR